ncbi:hypothetical protein [Stieleria varia]|uniref:Secreted protein n=1 Tax=Stieleria varia TaxID=2528005 RepID=A0A5C6A2U5_9BACT|nr:hypothetical protein [Stieleria varia]TWT93869.1 hypothetical protein Pla52n_56970 [Stieleria varia]
MSQLPQLNLRRCFLCGIAALSIGALFAPSSDAADSRRDENAEQAEMFAAIDAGQIDVKFIPMNATAANVLVRNLTDKPLNIQLPARFAGVPIDAQFGGGGMGGMGGGGMGGMGGGGMGGMGGGGGQSMGGGMGGGGMGGMGGGGMGGMGGGMMRVGPERQQKIAVQTVCLEHGKPDPNPKMAYKIVPLDQFTKDARVHVICEALGNRQVTQNTAQAATWHFTDNLSWEKLAEKNRVESKYTGNIPFFSPLELRTAVAVAAEATRLAEERKVPESESVSSESNDS